MGTHNANQEPRETTMNTAIQPHPSTIRSAEALRRTIASRRDALVGRQRRSYSRARQRLIDQLAADYDAALRMALAAGVEQALTGATQ